MRELKELWDGIVQGAVLPEGAVSLWLTTCVPVALEEDELVVDKKQLGNIVNALAE